MDKERRQTESQAVADKVDSLVRQVENILYAYENSLSDGYEYYGGSNAVENVAEEIAKKIRGKERDLLRFFENCSCLISEGREFMTRKEIIEAFEKECKKVSMPNATDHQRRDNGSSDEA